jgi:hypothetical protein
MRSAKIERFTQTRDCPPKDQLLSFRLAANPGESTSELVSHLEVCEVCDEAHSLPRSLTSPLPFISAEMPTHLCLLEEESRAKERRRITCPSDGRSVRLTS